MNRYLIAGLAIGLMVPLILAFQSTETGDSIQPVAVVQVKSAWSQVADITDANVSFGVDDRAFDSIVEITTNTRGISSYSAQDVCDVDPNWVVWKVPTDARTVQFCATVDADGNDAVVEVWGCPGQYIVGTNGLPASFQLGTTITWKGGTQIGPNSNVYCDTATTSDATMVTAAEDSATNRIATVTLPPEGLDAVAFVGTTVDTSVQIMARWGN
jgi:hypothetical protein